MTLTPIRRFWWRHVRRYYWEICQRCGRPASRHLGRNTHWFAPNTLWNRLHPDRVGILCASCFTNDARAQGVSISWVATETHTLGVGDPAMVALEEAHDLSAAPNRELP